MKLSTQQNDRPRNLLVILSDEHDPRYMGCSGAGFIQTPHLDALARRGTRFENAWTPSPICVPARAALATGRWTHQTRYWDNAIAYEGRWSSWHHRLAEAGVRVESIGKLHYRGSADPAGFQQQHEALHIKDGIGLVWGSVRDPMPATRGASPIFDDLGAGESSYNRYDARIADTAADWVNARASEAAGQPWALFVGFVAPHMPLVVPQPWLDLYPCDALPAFKLQPQHGHRRHPWVERMARHWDHDAALGSDERRQLAQRCYFGLVSYLDGQVGRVLAALEASGQAQDTTVVYTSDHGDNLGARGLWNKSTLYRESVGVPMIVAGPGIPAGQVRSTQASLVDLYPTALDACGIPALPEESALPGRSLQRMAQEADDPLRIGFSEYHAVGAESAAFMLAQGRYKYHHYVGHRPELFDLEADPEELHDLAADPRHAATCAGFESMLRAMLDPEAVDRQAKDDQNDLVIRFGGRDSALTRGNLGPTPVDDKYRMT
ncbi:sulfatase-like hydrolase/transferase [Variovorax saccharolyticus]|uniref:sulfatase-like hydrolase/transferase n=1 Tax=Variovorax saccharolyticus TaxID=3053516 RepID=UPI00257803AC|nr:sulfatase-like hydrolase/transferase [Variovorax sp. J22R187]MDM0018259.1 sulfatase-like hydrolase/transferase [Variovorax sp. J22R187]